MYVLHVFILCFFYGILALNWDLLFGRTAQIHFGYAAFFGVGAYVSTLFALNLGIPPFFGMFLGAVFAVGYGLIVCLLTSRLVAAYFAITTLALGEMARLIIARLDWLTRGYLMLRTIPPFAIPFLPAIDFGGADKRPYYFLLFFIMVANILAERRLHDSKVGIAFASIRDDQLAASTLGVRVLKYKVIATTVSAFSAGLVGSIYACYIGVLGPDALSVSVTFQLMAMTLIGGSGTLLGPVVGTFLVTFVLEFLRAIETYRYIVLGGLLMLVILFFDQGIMGIVERIKQTMPRRS